MAEANKISCGSETNENDLQNVCGPSLSPTPQDAKLNDEVGYSSDAERLQPLKVNAQYL